MFWLLSIVCVVYMSCIVCCCCALLCIFCLLPLIFLTSYCLLFFHLLIFFFLYFFSHLQRFALDGDVLIREGELSHTVYIISQGVVELFKTFNNGWTSSEPKLLRAIGDGCTFGAVSVVLDVRCHETAIAKGNVMLYAITKEHFKKIMKEFESSALYWENLCKLRKKRAEEFMTHGDMDEVDPEDAQTKLYQLSMQLAAAEEESNQMRSRSA